MTETFNNRFLTETESRLRADKRCIGCGVKMDVSRHMKKIDGKDILIRETWSFECSDCVRSRTRISAPTNGRNFGAARASVPFLLNGPMVRATLSCLKTEDRRPIKEELDDRGLRFCNDKTGWEDCHGRRITCPYSQPGNTLYVRETWRTAKGLDRLKPSWMLPGTPIKYMADADTSFHQRADSYEWGKTRPSIHMPKWASRIEVEVLDVTVERLQDISNNNAIREGILPTYTMAKSDIYPYFVTTAFYSPRQQFRNLWNNRYKGFTQNWNANPWVWVAKFKKLEG